jgi:hypothetical protein
VGAGVVLWPGAVADWSVALEVEVVLVLEGFALWFMLLEVEALLFWLLSAGGMLLVLLGEAVVAPAVAPVELAIPLPLLHESEIILTEVTCSAPLPDCVPCTST